MTCSLNDFKVRRVLGRLFDLAAHEEATPAALPAGFSFTEGALARRCEVGSHLVMPVSRRGGELLYTLARNAKPELIFEFGTSFGISTIYLAAAVADNGAGRVVSTEFNASKANAARNNLIEAGLRDRVRILQGDALETLREIEGPFGLALLDGWKDLCLPVLRSLEPKLAPGALVVADDTKQPAMHEYLDYVRARHNGYVSVAFPADDGMEVSCWA